MPLTLAQRCSHVFTQLDGGIHPFFCSAHFLFTVTKSFLQPIICGAILMTELPCVRKSLSGLLVWVWRRCNHFAVLDTTSHCDPTLMARSFTVSHLYPQ
jgi:hypothetical protein